MEVEEKQRELQWHNKNYLFGAELPVVLFEMSAL